MGGRGSGSSILGGHGGGLGIAENDKAKWRTIVADFNPNAGHREVHEWRTLEDFSAAAKKAGNSECEFLGVMKDGYFVKVAQGTDGSCTYSNEMRKDMIGCDITHYHNRYEATPQEIEEAEKSIKEWGGVKRAFDRYNTANGRLKDANQRLKDANRQIRLNGGNESDDTAPANASPRLRAAFAEKQAAWREYQLATRQKTRAEQDYNERYKAYTNKEPNGIRLPERKNVIIDNTGIIGGCFSATDIDSNLLAEDIPSFSASCDEGTYTVSLRKGLNPTTPNQLFTARARIRNLFTPAPIGNQRDRRTDEAKTFQRHLNGIDRKTAEEGRKNGWSRQQIVATSINRQLAYFWEKEKAILGENNINATFKPNPNYKPKWSY